MTRNLTSQRRSRRRYNFGETIIRIGNKILCPACLSLVDKDDVERHHVQAVMDGGLDFSWNVLVICMDCHALATFGTTVSRGAYQAVCSRYMMARYGLLWCLQIQSLRGALRRHFTEEIESGRDGLSLKTVRDGNTRIKSEWFWEYHEILGLILSQNETELRKYFSGD